MRALTDPKLKTTVMEDVDIESCTEIIVHGGHEVAPAPPRDDDVYAARIASILQHFRREAGALMSTQPHQLDRQTVNHDQVMSLFHVYAQVQAARQLDTEQRLQLALAAS